MKRKRPGFWLAWCDMLYGQLATFTFLFIVAFVVLRPEAKKQDGVELKAEYLITMTWPDGNLDDVDLHVRLPDGSMVNFRSKEVAYVMLDHDDRGINGQYTNAEGKVMLLRGHKEVATVRAIVPGTYVANVHIYRVNDSYLDQKSDPVLPYAVQVTLTRLNPQVEDVASADVVMSEVGQQKTAFAFTVQEDGSVQVDKDADVPFIPTAPPIQDEAAR